jgi:uncharacterized RDD family membrane protein YckC
MTDPHDERPYLAEWWPRVGATLLDGLIVWALSVVAIVASFLIAAPFGGESDVGAPVWLLLWAVLAVAYLCLSMARKGRYNGQTLGKQAAGVRVVRDDGQPVTLKTAFGRDILVKCVGGTVTLGVGWIIDSLWPLGDSENRALHDHAASTHVVSTAPPPRPQIVEAPVVQYPQLAPPIAQHFDAARRIQYAIGTAVHQAQLPFSSVSREVDALIGQLWQSALRANMLHDALAETPVERIEQRLAELQFQKSPELIGALREQLVVQKRMAGQLERYDTEMERIVVELDTVRANIVSVSASGDLSRQEQLAETVRELRDEMSAVGEGMDEAYG